MSLPARVSPPVVLLRLPPGTFPRPQAMNGHPSRPRVMPAVTTAPPPAVDTGHAPRAGAGGLQRRGGQPHLWGFTSRWVTAAEVWGPPNRSLLPTRLGKGSGRAGRQRCRADVVGLRGWERSAFSPGTVGFANSGGSLTPAWCSEEASAVPAPGPCSPPPSSSARGDAGLGSFKGREKNQLPPSFGFCGAASPQDPCRPPPGEVQPIFR